MKHIKENVNVGLLTTKQKYSEYEYVSKPNQNGEVDNYTKNKILNVENFNRWLQGVGKIVGKTYLEPSLVEDYFLDQGVECSNEEIFSFISTIKNQWNKNNEMNHIKSFENFNKI